MRIESEKLNTKCCGEEEKSRVLKERGGGGENKRRRRTGEQGVSLSHWPGFSEVTVQTEEGGCEDVQRKEASSSLYRMTQRRERKNATIQMCVSADTFFENIS